MEPDFKHWHDLEVRWDDLDRLGHVNNARFFTYLEAARLAYLEEVKVWSLEYGTLQGPILARASCDFRKEICFPCSISVGTGAIRLGRRSFQTRQGIFSRDRSALFAQGKSVLVWFDYRTRRSIDLSAEVRQKLIAFEGNRLEIAGASSSPGGS